jgi:colanic acid/amylovoran biosynthesis glycosyltransferase
MVRPRRSYVRGVEPPSRQASNLSESARSRLRRDVIGNGHRLLFINHVPQVHWRGAVYFDRQTLAGLEQYARYFDAVTICGPRIDSPHEPDPMFVAPLAGHDQRITLEPLPLAYSPAEFFRTRQAVRATLSRLVDSHDVVVGAVGGLVGDWGSTLASVCYGRKKPHAVWFDRLESDVIRVEWADAGFLRRARHWVERLAIKRRSKRLVRRATLTIGQGAETFAALSPHAANIIQAFDSHVVPEDVIGADAFQSKIASLRSGPVSIAYAGRVEAMKGPLDWIRALHVARCDGLDFVATWFGDGPLLDTADSLVRELELSDRVSFAGAVSHVDTFDGLRRAAIIFHAHLTIESPRTIVEALAAGCAIVGYHSPYVDDVLGYDQTGPERGNWVALGHHLAIEARRTELLETRIARNAERGKRFLEEPVYRHRAATMASLVTDSRPNDLDPRRT